LPEFRNPNLESQGPGGGGSSGGDFRSLMAFTFLALAVVLGFEYFKPKPATPPHPVVQQSQQVQQPAQPSSSQPTTTAAPEKASPATPAIAASAETETTIENGLYKIVFTNRGAQVKHWFLEGKQYKDHPGPDGHQLDLVNEQTAAFGLPLSLYTYEPALNKTLNDDALYQVNVSGGSANGNTLKAPGSITFHYAANGLDVVKTFRFDSSYVITAEVQVRRDGIPVRALLAWPNGLGDQTDTLQYVNGKFDWSLNGKLDSVAAKKVSNNETFNQPYEYAAVSDLYFAAAFLPDVPSRATVVTLHHSIEAPSDASDPKSQKKPVDVLGLAVGDTSGYTRLRLYTGPKEMDVLNSVHAMGADGKPDGPSLEPLIQFGMWTILAKPLYLALRFLVQIMGTGVYNWGWAIIIFTAVFNFALLPTRFMAMKSSLKMMRIQPKVDALKRRYSHLKMNDPKRSEMNAEMMALYKDEGVNMYGGCLPMLPQIPLFFAYFRVLQYAVELRQAHWFWLPDLSAPDPLYILPILIIVSMFLVQYITPSPGMDPTQRRMMAIMMPLFFGFMLLHYASGLALYWATSNLINLGMQIGINQSSMGKEMHAIAARRAAKKSDSGTRTLQGRR
jgi:YidC/Oxa1 family membrane protein insertase